MNSIVLGDCLEIIRNVERSVDLTFFDPPFNQNKSYNSHNDNMDYRAYWDWMDSILSAIYIKSSHGAGIYFMQREKNVAEVISVLRNTGWIFQNLVIWKKKASAVPSRIRYAKQYQVIVYATKGHTPKVFNRLRIDPILLVTEKYKRENGVFVTDVWDDIRELTSGYFAGDEPLRDDDGSRVHNQQSPIELLLRIILTSTNIGDWVLDPFAGTGTTHIVASQLQRNSICIEKDARYHKFIIDRVEKVRNVDNIERYRQKYIFTDGLDTIWGGVQTWSDRVITHSSEMSIFDINDQ